MYFLGISTRVQILNILVKVRTNNGRTTSGKKVLKVRLYCAWITYIDRATRRIGLWHGRLRQRWIRRQRCETSSSKSTFSNLFYSITSCLGCTSYSESSRSFLLNDFKRKKIIATFFLFQWVKINLQGCRTFFCFNI